MLEELGVAYTHTPARPWSRDARSLNPFGKVPVLVEGNFTMSESAAINTYLGDKFRNRVGGSDLVPPAGTTSRGRYEQLVHCMMAELDSQGLWIHRKHAALGQFFGDIPAAVAHAHTHVEKVIKVLVGELRASRGSYLLGTDFTAADILFVHCLNWAESIGWATWCTSDSSASQDPDADLINAYLERCRERPAYRAVQAILKNERRQADAKAAAKSKKAKL